MTQTIGYYGGNYSNPQIQAFSEQFECQTGNCKLPEIDQKGLCAVLSLYGFLVEAGISDSYWEAFHRVYRSETGITTGIKEGTPIANAIEMLAGIPTDQAWVLVNWMTN